MSEQKKKTSQQMKKASHRQRKTKPGPVNFYYIFAPDWF